MGLTDLEIESMDQYASILRDLIKPGKDLLTKSDLANTHIEVLTRMYIHVLLNQNRILGNVPANIKKYLKKHYPEYTDKDLLYLVKIHVIDLVLPMEIQDYYLQCRISKERQGRIEVSQPAKQRIFREEDLEKIRGEEHK